MDGAIEATIAAMASEPIALSTGSNLSQMSSNWVAATFYVGASRLARVSDDARTLRFLSAVADHYNYGLRGGRSGKTLLNADDIAEAEWMRAQGSTLGRLRDWAPSPVWPEGRGLMLARPMLAWRRRAHSRGAGSADMSVVASVAALWN